MKKFILLLLCLVTCAASAMGSVGCSKDTDSETKQEDTFTPVSDGGNYTPDGNY